MSAELATAPTTLALSREEKASLLAGSDTWHLRAIPRLDIPPMLVADCGHGVTLCGDRSSPATCFPTGIGLASTWNPDLMREVGATIGRDCLALGVSILLGPMLNLHRIPLNGRSFETFSEDPLLAGCLGAAIIRGIQAQGVGACVKALAGNNQQKDQHTTSSEIDPRTLRELYLRVFEIAIAEGSPCSAMTSYNLLNGEATAECEFLIRRVLKGDWAFPGLVMSDWRAVQSEAVYRSGLDLEMPGPGKFLNTANVLRALDSGQLSEDDLDDKATRFVALAKRYARDEAARGPFEHLLDSPESRRVALRAAEESIVLLKNDGPILPLDRRAIRRIAVIGPNAANARLGGGGSASVTPFYSVSPLDGIRALCGPETEVLYEEGGGLVGSLQTIVGALETPREEGGWQPGLKAEFFNGGEPGETADATWIVPQVDFSWGWAAPGPGVTRYEYAARFSGRLVPRRTGKHKIAAYGQEGCLRLKIGGQTVVDHWVPLRAENDFEAAYATRHQTAELDLRAGVPVDLVLEYGKRAARAAVRLEWEEPGADDPVTRAAALARSADVAILCCGLSNLFEGGSVDRTSLDLPPGQLRLIDAVAAANPRTVVVLNNGGPLALPWEPRVPAILEAWYPGQEGGNAIARILFGETNPSGKLPDTIARRLEDHAAYANYPGRDGKEEYAEGVFIGYRHFDRAGIEPHYPFGYGLSYTRFEATGAKLVAREEADDWSAEVSVRLTNVGDRAGAETVQLYVRDAECSVPRPPKELRGFAKVHLKPGESREVTLRLGWRDLAFWDAGVDGWRVEPGDFEALVGTGPGDLQRLAFSVRSGGVRRA